MGEFSKSHRMPAWMKFAAPTAVRYDNTTLTACPGQVRLVLDKRVGDAVTFALTIGAVRSA